MPKLYEGDILGNLFDLNLTIVIICQCHVKLLYHVLSSPLLDFISPSCLAPYRMVQGCTEHNITSSFTTFNDWRLFTHKGHLVNVISIQLLARTATPNNWILCQIA